MPVPRDAYVLAMSALATGWLRAKISGPTGPFVAPADVEELIALGSMAKRLSGYDPAAQPEAAAPSVPIPPGGTLNLTVPAMDAPAAAETPAS